MRTTVNIDEGLLETAKARAAEQGLTLGDLLEASLQHYLTLAPTRPRTSLPVFEACTGLAAGIDPSSNSSLYEAMYADDPQHS